MLKKNILVFLVLIVCVFLDFFRDYLFQNINFQIHYLNHFIDGTPSTLNMTDSRIEQLIDQLNLFQLKNIKWMLSTLFIVFYQVLTLVLSKILFKKYFLKISFPIVLILCLFASLCFILSHYSDTLIHQYSFYYISIEISHFLQSSLIVISLLMIFKVYLLLKTTSNK